MLDYDLCFFDIYALTYAINAFPLSVQDTWQIEDVDGIDGPPWTPDQVREWNIYGLSIYVIAYVTYEWVYYDVVYGSFICFVDGCRMTIAC